MTPDERRVVRDRLLEQGDPRGEYIALHDSDADEAELRRRALWQLHGDAWLRADLGRTDLYARYRGGWLDELHVEQEQLTAALVAPRALHVSRLTDLDALARMPLLREVETLELGYGLQTASADQLARVLEAAPRVTALALSPHEDVPFVWDALARWSRLAELTSLEVTHVRIAPERARWLGGALPKLQRLHWQWALQSASLHELFALPLTELSLYDSDGLHGRQRLLSDEALAAAMRAFPNLTSLSLTGSPCGERVTAALAALPATLASLDLGSTSRRVVDGLADATLPALTWLSIRHCGLSNLDVVARFPTLTDLRAEKNPIDHRAVEPVLRLPALVEVNLGDSHVGDHGAIALAHADTKLRHLGLSYVGLGNDAAEALADGKLAELRTLNLAVNDAITRKGFQALARGAFDKLSELNLAHLDPPAALFDASWVSLGGDRFARKLAPDGSAVPHARGAKKKPAPTTGRAIDETSDYAKGEHVAHPDYGIGTVAEVAPLYLVVKFPTKGAYRFARVPSGAVPYSAAGSFSVGQILAHPTLGAGTVAAATRDRIEVDFGVGGRKTLIHKKI